MENWSTKNFVLGIVTNMSIRPVERKPKLWFPPSDDAEPFFGFYNRGLTLKEGVKEYHPGVAFKVSSRYLELTLTRDNVITDKHYEKAMALLAQVIDGPFRKQLFNRAASSFDYELFGHLAPRLGKRIPSEYANMPLLPTVGGERVPIRTVVKAAKKQKNGDLCSRGDGAHQADHLRAGCTGHQMGRSPNSTGLGKDSWIGLRADDLT